VSGPLGPPLRYSFGQDGTCKQIKQKKILVVEQINSG